MTIRKAWAAAAGAALAASLGVVTWAGSPFGFNGDCACHSPFGNWGIEAITYFGLFPGAEEFGFDQIGPGGRSRSLNEPRRSSR